MASADIPSFDLYTCEVCLENMLNKNPRLLSCHHSFCTDCLRKIMKNGSILCPTCREETVIHNNDVNMLKANFMLQKVKEHIDTIHSSKTLLCQLCLSESASLKCQECLQLLCGDCKHQHNKVQTFKHHKIYKLCKKHKEGLITHVCVKCVQLACAKCVIKEHAECEVKTYEEGIEHYRIKMSKCEDEIENVIQAINKFKEEHEKKVEKVDLAISRAKDIKQYFQQKAREAEKSIEILNASKTDGERTKQTIDIQLRETEKVKQLMKKRLEEIQNGIFCNIVETENEIQQVSKGAENILNFNLPDVTIVDPKTGKEICLISEKKKKFINRNLSV